MGKSAQKNGVAMTSISVKMSLAVSMIGMILIYNETITLFKIIGILLALSGVLLISFEKNKSGTSTNSLKMLLILFIGSGILDLAFKLYSAACFNSFNACFIFFFWIWFSRYYGTLILIYQAYFKSVFHQIQKYCCWNNSRNTKLLFYFSFTKII